MIIPCSTHIDETDLPDFKSCDEANELYSLYQKKTIGLMIEQGAYLIEACMRELKKPQTKEKRIEAYEYIEMVITDIMRMKQEINEPIKEDQSLLKATRKLIKELKK